MPEENVQTPVEETTATEETNPEMATMEQIVELIAGLSPEGQRQLMSFLNQELGSVVAEEEEEFRNSPEEQERKAAVMSEAM